MNGAQVMRLCRVESNCSHKWGLLTFAIMGVTKQLHIFRFSKNTHPVGINGQMIEHSGLCENSNKYHHGE